MLDIRTVVSRSEAGAFARRPAYSVQRLPCERFCSIESIRSFADALSQVRADCFTRAYGLLCRNRDAEQNPGNGPYPIQPTV
jgi:hypothetical protein